MSQQLYSQLRPVYQSLIIYPLYIPEKSRPLSVEAFLMAGSQLLQPVSQTFVLSL